MASLAEKLAALEDVEIDESGRFKYILIKVFAGSTSKFIVRGYDWAEYHGMYCSVFYCCRSAVILSFTTKNENGHC